MTKLKPEGTKTMISEETRAYYDLKKRNDVRKVYKKELEKNSSDDSGKELKCRP